MEPINFEFVTVEEAKRVLDGPPPLVAEPDWTDLRRPLSPQEQALTPAALKWLAHLPREARPLELCWTYPRIANRLAEIWGAPALLSAYLGDLLIDKRGGRQGFPGGIALELTRLQEHLLRTNWQP